MNTFNLDPNTTTPKLSPAHKLVIYLNNYHPEALVNADLIVDQLVVKIPKLFQPTIPDTPPVADTVTISQTRDIFQIWPHYTPTKLNVTPLAINTLSAVTMLFKPKTPNQHTLS